MNRLLLASTLGLVACCTPASGGGAPGAPLHTIGPDHAGGLKTATPFTIPAIERAFEGLEVVSVSDPEQPRFLVRLPGSETPLYVVTPDWTRGYAGAVSTSSADVGGPGGLRAGRSRLSEVPEELRAACHVPEDAGEISLSCETGSFQLDFTGTGPDPLLALQTYLPPLP